MNDDQVIIDPKHADLSFKRANTAKKSFHPVVATVMFVTDAPSAMKE